MKLKLSQFTLPLHDYPQKGHHLLYNTLTRAMTRLDADEWRLLERLPNPPADEQARSLLADLCADGFVVPRDVDEGEEYVRRLDRARGNTDQFFVTLSLIQSCNFGCGYCYQGGPATTHDGSKITRQGVAGSVRTDEIIEFLKSQCETRSVKTLFLTAYGGEPLLNKPALVEIVKTMQLYCQRQGINWSFGMVSNGSLLTRKTVLELLPYGFRQVQITIDGNQQTHDQSRPWKSPKGKGVSTYDVIMRNLSRWAGLIHTDVLCVVSPSTLDAAHELVETLAAKGYAKKRVRMRFSPISPTYDPITLQKLAESELPSAESEIAAAITDLHIHAARRGLIEDLRPRGTWCAVLRANGQHVTLTPDGKVYSCALFIGRDEKYSTGDIATGTGGGLDALMKKFFYPAECKRCRYLPICANCRAEALSKTGDLLGANSQQARYDRSLPELIKAHYQLLSSRPSGNGTARRQPPQGGDR